MRLSPLKSLLFFHDISTLSCSMILVWHLLLLWCITACVCMISMIMAKTYLSTRDDNLILKPKIELLWAQKSSPRKFVSQDIFFMLASLLTCSGMGIYPMLLFHKIYFNFWLSLIFVQEKFKIILLNGKWKRSLFWVLLFSLLEGWPTCLFCWQGKVFAHLSAAWGFYLLDLSSKYQSIELKTFDCKQKNSGFYG